MSVLDPILDVLTLCRDTCCGFLIFILAQVPCYILGRRGKTIYFMAH